MSLIESTLDTFFSTLASTTTRFLTPVPLPNLSHTAEAAEILPQTPNPIVSAVSSHLTYVGAVLRSFYLGPPPSSSSSTTPKPAIAPQQVRLILRLITLPPTKPWYERHARSMIIGLDAMILLAILIYLAFLIALNWRHLFCADRGRGEVEVDGASLAKFAKEGDDMTLAAGLAQIINEWSCRGCLVKDVKVVLRAKKSRLVYAKGLLEREWVGCEKLEEERRGLIAGITRLDRAIAEIEEDEKMAAGEDFRVEIRGGKSEKCYYRFESKGTEVGEEKPRKRKLLKAVKKWLRKCYWLLVLVLWTSRLPSGEGSKEAVVRALEEYCWDDATSDDNNKVQDIQEMYATNDDRGQKTQEVTMDATSIDSRVQDTQEGTVVANEIVEAPGGHQRHRELVDDIEQMVEEYAQHLREMAKRPHEEAAESASAESSDWEELNSGSEDEDDWPRDATFPAPTEDTHERTSYDFDSEFDDMASYTASEPVDFLEWD